MSTMGTLSRQSGAGATVGESAPADTAPDTTTPAHRETGQREASAHDGVSGEEQQVSTWGNSGDEKQFTARAADAESPETYSGGSAATKEEQLPVQQQGEHEIHNQDESEDEKPNETSSSCAICGKEARKSDVGERSSWVCEVCSRKQQQQGGADEAHERARPPEETCATREDRELSQSREGPSESTEYNTPKVAGASRSTSSSSNIGGSGSSTAGPRGRNSPGGAVSAAAGAAGSRKCIDEGSVRRHVVPVGPRHQVPCLPPFFLEGGGQGCCCGGEPTPVLDPSLTARLVYSPSSLERVRQRRLAEGLADRAICSEGDMEAFMHQCAKNWKANKPGWQPFSPEFAFKLLHHAGYDPAKALQLMEDPQFPFQLVCDGPVRRYDNKWRPKDRRGVISPTPYPPPVFLRGYLSRRHYRDSSGYSLR